MAPHPWQLSPPPSLIVPTPPPSHRCTLRPSHLSHPNYSGISTQIVSKTWMTLVHHPAFVQPQFRLHYTLTTSPVSQHCPPSSTHFFSFDSSCYLSTIYFFLPTLLSSLGTFFLSSISKLHFQSFPQFIVISSFQPRPSLILQPLGRKPQSTQHPSKLSEPAKH